MSELTIRGGDKRNAEQADEPGRFPWEDSYPANLSWREPLELQSMTALMDRAFADHAGKTMIEFEGREISYAEMAGYVERLAFALRQKGLGKGDVVALYFPNCPYHPAGFFASLRAGCRVVCLSPLDALRELRFKLEDSGARTLLTLVSEPFASNAAALAAAGAIDRWIAGHDDFWLPRTEGEGRGESCLAGILAGPNPPPQHWPEAAIDDVALIQYTGGTTGSPKGARITHGNLSAGVSMFNLRFQAADFSRPGEEKLLGVLPLFHIYALVGVLLRSVRSGDLIALRRRFDAEQVLADFDAGRVTWFFGVPTMFIALIDRPDIDRFDLRGVTCCIAGGAPLPVEVGQSFERLTGHGIGVGWGMTESMGAGTLTNPAGLERLASIGLPLPGATMRIVDQDNPDRLLPVGEIGEICMAGPHVCAGYWNRSKDDAATFRDGWLLTGDLGYMDEDGYFYLVDRKKDLILSGGYNVYPRMIEEAIYEHDAVEEVLVYGIADAYRGEAAKAAIKLKAGRARFSLEDLRAFLSSRVGRHELPTALEFRDALPRTAVGKLSRKELVAEESARTALAAEPGGRE